MDGVLHSPDSRPINGLLQLVHGPGDSLAFLGMKQKLDVDAQEALDTLLDIIRDNVRQLMDEQFADKTNRPLALGKASGVGKATVQRILKGANRKVDSHPPPNIKTLVALSWRFRVPLQRLLTDHSRQAVLLQPVEHAADEIPIRSLQRRRSRKSAD